MIGSVAAALIIVCGRVIFADLVLPPSLEISTRFLLPFTTTLLSFWSIKQILSSFALRNVAFAQAFSTTLPSNKKLFLPDIEALEDGRIVDLARTGLFDGQIVIPNFLQKEIKALSECPEESLKQRGKRALESIRRLETFSKISAQGKDVFIPEVGNFAEKLVRAAHSLEAMIITSEFSPLKLDASPGLYLAIDSIANAVRPPIPKGEHLFIKIQRLGKEPKQGIGYLDDGTMVVVNGGGDHLGKMVKTQVLSQKYSSSGKIVFCNVREDGTVEEKISPLSYSQNQLN